MKKIFLPVMLLSALLIVSGCLVFQCQSDEECIPSTPLVGTRYLCEEGVCVTKPLGNPASENCLAKGGEPSFRQDQEGGTYSVCVFEDDSECEEWKFYRGECQTGQHNAKLNLYAGKIVALQNAEFDDYFAMLNGTEVGIEGQTDELKKELAALRGSGKLVQVAGLVVLGNDYLGQKLVVSRIFKEGEKPAEILEEEAKEEKDEDSDDADEASDADDPGDEPVIPDPDQESDETEDVTLSPSKGDDPGDPGDEPVIPDPDQESDETEDVTLSPSKGDDPGDPGDDPGDPGDDPDEAGDADEAEPVIPDPDQESDEAAEISALGE